jgi:very-short-patch-repair endonuclease
VLELDGSQHLEQTEYDQERTAFLESRGYRVVRIWNSQVESNIEGVIRNILGALEVPA